MLSWTGHGFGYGDGSGSGFGHGHGFGSGFGFGHGHGEEVGEISGYKVRWLQEWSVLVIGCEVHTLSTWQREGEDIARRHDVEVTDEMRERFGELVKEWEIPAGEYDKEVRGE